MRLADFERRGSDERPRLVARIDDAAGEGAYELVITGPGELIGVALGDADVTVQIDTSAAQDRADEEVRAIDAEDHRVARDLSGLGDDVPLHDLFKSAPEGVDVRRSVLTSLRRTDGEGTYYEATYAGLGPLPAGVNLIAFVPPSLVVGAVVVPRTGDQDLYHYLGSSAQPVRSSTRPGTLVDALSLVTAASPYFYMFWRVHWFTGGTCGLFRYVGHAGRLGLP